MKYLDAVAGKFVYGLFILWVGVLAPFVYFDPFAIDHYIPPYRLAIFQPSVHPREAAVPEAVVARLIRQLKQRFLRQQDLISARSPLSGPAHLLQWSLGPLYLGAGAINLQLLLAGRLALTEQPAGASADLPPPKKPPRR